MDFVIPGTICGAIESLQHFHTFLQTTSTTDFFIMNLACLHTKFNIPHGECTDLLYDLFSHR